MKLADSWCRSLSSCIPTCNFLISSILTKCNNSHVHQYWIIYLEHWFFMYDYAVKWCLRCLKTKKLKLSWMRCLTRIIVVNSQPHVLKYTESRKTDCPWRNQWISVPQLSEKAGRHKGLLSYCIETQSRGEHEPLLVTTEPQSSLSYNIERKIFTKPLVTC